MNALVGSLRLSAWARLGCELNMPSTPSPTFSKSRGTKCVASRFPLVMMRMSGDTDPSR